MYAEYCALVKPIPADDRKVGWAITTFDVIVDRNSNRVIDAENNIASTTNERSYELVGKCLYTEPKMFGMTLTAFFYRNSGT